MLSVRQARKILGKAGDDSTDEDILKDIEAASLLKDLFFHLYLSTKEQAKAEENTIGTKGVQSI